jgi:hypothetical protein
MVKSLINDGEDAQIYMQPSVTPRVGWFRDESGWNFTIGVRPLCWFRQYDRTRKEVETPIPQIFVGN